MSDKTEKCDNNECRDCDKQDICFLLKRFEEDDSVLMPFVAMLLQIAYHAQSEHGLRDQQILAAFSITLGKVFALSGIPSDLMDMIVDAGFVFSNRVSIEGIGNMIKPVQKSNTFVN